LFIKIIVVSGCLFSLIHCNEDNSDVVLINASYEAMNESLEKRSRQPQSENSDYQLTKGDAASLLMLNSINRQNSKPSYVGKVYSSYETLDRSLSNLVGFAINRSGYTLSADSLHHLVESFLLQKELNALVFDSIYAHGLQKASFEIGHRAAFKEPSSTNRDNLIEHYLEIAVVQKAVDTDAMADMFLEVESQLEQSFRTQARNYILAQSQADLSEAMVKLEKFHAQFKIEGQSLWDSPTVRMSFLHYKDVFESAQDAINRL